MREDECILVRGMMLGDFQAKLAQKLKLEYQYYSQLHVSNSSSVKEISTCIAYVSWALFSGCRPWSNRKIKVKNVSVLVTPSTVAARNKGETLANLQQGETHAIKIVFKQSKSDRKFDDLLVAAEPWEETSIEVIHTYCADARWAPRGDDDLLFPGINHDGYGMRTYIKSLMTHVAFSCSITSEIKMPILRKLFANQLLSDSLDEFYEKRFRHPKSKRGCIAAKKACSAALTRCMKEVSSRLGHRKYEATNMASYLDPLILVDYAHACGFHRNTMDSYKYLTRTMKAAAGHPWMSDSDEDSDHYPKAEDESSSDDEG